MTAAPTPIASPVDSRVGLAVSQSAAWRRIWTALGGIGASRERPEPALECPCRT
jgi:hypothetical protein